LINSQLPVKDFVSSDPYVVVRIGDNIIAKTKVVTRNLSPTWNEEFQTPLLHCRTPVQFLLYDFDFGNEDDYMGSVEVSLVSVQLGEPCLLQLPVMCNKSSVSAKGFLTINIAIHVSRLADLHFYS
jgi:Ca2+-dependent lipid-binding protein